MVYHAGNGHPPAAPTTQGRRSQAQPIPAGKTTSSQRMTRAQVHASALCHHSPLMRIATPRQECSLHLLLDAHAVEARPAFLFLPVSVAVLALSAALSVHKQLLMVFEHTQWGVRESSLWIPRNMRSGQKLASMLCSLFATAASTQLCPPTLKSLHFSDRLHQQLSIGHWHV